MKLGLEAGDLVNVVVEKKALQLRNNQQKFEVRRVIPEAEWKRLQIANLEAALRQSNGKVMGPNGAAELLGVPATTLFQRIKKAGIDIGKTS
jgi:transcriptional regulator with GAF, ATPase, and Fis domain